MKKWFLILSVFLPFFSARGDSSDRPLIQVDFEQGEITRKVERAIEVTKSQVEAIKNLRAKKMRFSNTVLALENALYELSLRTTPLMFMSSVHKDEKIREEANEVEKLLSKYGLEIFSDRGLYVILKDQKAGNESEARLFKEMLVSFEDNGVSLSEEKFQEFLRLNKRLIELNSDFGLNLANDTSRIAFSKEELKGLPENFFENREMTSDGKFIVTAKTPDALPVRTFADSEETRMKMYLLYYNQATEKNIPLMEEAVRVRDQVAKLRGFPTFADMNLKDRMAKDAATVNGFLEDLKLKLANRNSEELSRLLEVKKKSDPKATEIYPWDTEYYGEKLRKELYQYDVEALREYFPTDRVIAGVFDIYSRLFGVRFEEVTDAKTWAEGVKLYKVFDSATERFIGNFFADLYPREGKYNHFAHFGLIHGRQAKRSYAKPLSSIVGNFRPPTKTLPSLMDMREVETFFHEFGHLMHFLLTKAPYGSLSGTSVLRDFVEAPSQMLENWVWDRTLLTNLSGHYKDSRQKIPADILEKVFAARDFNKGLHYTRQVLLATFDMGLHTNQLKGGVSQYFRDLAEKITGMKQHPQFNFPASFGHLMGGYEAGYYGYLWSEVLAEAMFSKFEEEGIMNEDLGRAYRKKILEVGNMKEPQEIVEDFIEGKVSNQSFYKKLGICDEKLNF